jgi:hypothetical protein
MPSAAALASIFGPLLEIGARVDGVRAACACGGPDERTCDP